MTNELAFDRVEYAARVQKAREEMSKRGLDAVFITHPSNIVYLTGYSADSDYVPQGLIITAGNEEPKIITRNMDALSGTQTAYLKQSSIIGYPETYIGVSDKDGYDFIIDHMIGAGLSSKSIGVEMGSGNFSAATWQKFQSRLPNAKFADFTGVVTWNRLIKSPAEITYLRQAAEISDLAMKAVVDVIGPGVRQRDAGAALLAALAKGTDEFGSDRALHPNMPAGRLINAPHLAWTDGVYNVGDAVNIELGGRRKRYAAGLSRSVCVGRPSAAMLDLHKTVLEGMDSALSFVKPGNVCGQAWDAFSAVVSKKGYTKTSRIGYSIGIDWLEATASLQHGDRTEFVPNMVLHMICGMWEEKDIGYVLSNTFVVTQNGFDFLGKTPRELFVKE